MPCRLPLRCSFGLALLLSTVAAAEATLVPGPSAVVTETDSWDPYAPPAITASDDGSFLVVWTDPSFNGQERVYARAFDAAAQPLGPATLVSPTGLAKPGALPSVVALPAVAGGGYLVAWAEAITASFDDFVMACLLGPDGSPVSLAAPIGVMDEQSAWPGGPALAVDAGGVIFVAWSRGGRIEVHRLATQHGPPPTVETSKEAYLVPLGSFDAGEGIYPSVAAVPGGIVVAALRLGIRHWLPGSSGNDRVVVRRFAADGTPGPPEHVVSTTGVAEALAVRVTSDTAGRFLLAWYEVDVGAAAGEPWDHIFAQRFAADGAPLAGVTTVVAGSAWPPAGQGYPPALVLGDAVSRADGSSLVTWSQNQWLVVCSGPPGPPFPDPVFPNQPGCGGSAGDGAVYARSFTADGTAVGEVLSLAQANGTLQLAGRAAAAPTGWVTLRHGGEVAATLVGPGDCGDGVEPSGTALCLAGHFRVEASWAAAGGSGPARPLSLTLDSGALWFFSPGNLELVVKVLDGSAVNGRYWVFFASLTDVAFELVVTDTRTGAQRRYSNPQGTMASRADTAAFPSVVDEPPPAAADASAGPAGPSPTGASIGSTPRTGGARARIGGLSPCLPWNCVTPLSLVDGRFLARVEWRVDETYYGYGAAHPFSRDTGLFSFFSPQNQEVALKVLDGRGVNGHFWVFFASLTDVDFDLYVLDTVTGEERVYHNPAGTMASRADVEAF